MALDAREVSRHRAHQREALPHRPTREIRIMRDKRLTLATWIVIGAGVGVALGVAMNNLALWMAIGVGMGVAIGAGQSGLGRK
jgi:urocanate hydratase